MTSRYHAQTTGQILALKKKSGLNYPKGGLMRRYETIVIIDPDISDDDRGSLITRIQEIMVQKNGALLELDDWGVKRLAYEIRKKIRGYYVRFD
jgi:hypothetical protein